MPVPVLVVVEVVMEAVVKEEMFPSLIYVYLREWHLYFVISDVSSLPRQREMEMFTLKMLTAAAAVVVVHGPIYMQIYSIYMEAEGCISEDNYIQRERERERLV